MSFKVQRYNNGSHIGSLRKFHSTLIHAHVTPLISIIVSIGYLMIIDLRTYLTYLNLDNYLILSII